MSAVLRPLLIYISLLLAFRLSGKRTLGEITSFDFVVLLIVSEAVSSSLLSSDTSLTGAMLAVLTLLFLDLLLAALKLRMPRLARLLEDEPVQLMRDGRLLREHMAAERVDEDDILEAARKTHGIDRLDAIDAAVLERRGTISIIPARS